MGSESDMVNWPTGLRDTDEDGMRVIAYWPVPADHQTGDGTLTVDLYEVITEGHPVDQVEQVYPGYMALYHPDEHTPEPSTVSRPLFDEIALGDTRHTWFDDSTEHYWVATRDDLTDAGRALVAERDARYGVPAVLLTHLST